MNSAKRLAKLVVNLIDSYAPGFKNSILHRQVLTPLDLEEIYGLSEGHPYHAELALDQIFFMRPLPGWSRYRTPINNLYLCGSGTHPGGGHKRPAGLLRRERNSERFGTRINASLSSRRRKLSFASVIARKATFPDSAIRADFMKLYLGLLESVAAAVRRGSLANCDGKLVDLQTSPAPRILRKPKAIRLTPMNSPLIIFPTPSPAFSQWGEPAQKLPWQSHVLRQQIKA